MKSSLSIVVASSTLALLSACGGGSDSSSAPTSAPTAITSSNQTNVARASIDGGLAVSLAQAGVGGGTKGADAATRSHALSVAVRHALEATRHKSVASAGTHVAAITSTTNNCSNGGTFTISFNDKDGNGQLSSGDVLSTTFAQCREGATLSLNGAAVITLTSAPTASLLAVSAQFQNLVLVDSSTTASINGTVAISETDVASVTTDALQVGPDGLTVGITSAAYNDTVTFGSGASITMASPDAGGSSSVAVNGKLSASSLNGSVTIATLTPVTALDTDTYPSSGQLRITGAAGSTLLVTVLNNAQVRLDLDSNGDGTVDGTTTVAWSTLLP